MVLSHGHLDHSWGLDALIRQRTEAIIEGKDSGGPATRPVLTAHPLALAPRSVDNIPQIGAHLTREELARHFTLRLTDAPTPLTPRIHFLGEIPRRFDFEDSPPMGMRLENESAVPDTLEDDTGLALGNRIRPGGGHGCAHAGCLQHRGARPRRHGREERAQRHRRIPSPRRIGNGGSTPLCRYLRELEPEALYPCHCTGPRGPVAPWAARPRCATRARGSHSPSDPCPRRRIMEKILIIGWKNTMGEVCIGCSRCMVAFNRRVGAFEEYKDKEAELIGILSCGGLPGRVHRAQNGPVQALGTPRSRKSPRPCISPRASWTTAPRPRP